MSARHRHILFGWVGLMLLWALEFGFSFMPMPRHLRVVLIIPALLMVALVGFVFMRVRSGPSVVRVFALAGLVWLTILLGLGSMDPLTRAVYPVEGTQLP
jgi:cytochrome c oxidase subunit 4